MNKTRISTESVAHLGFKEDNSSYIKKMFPNFPKWYIKAYLVISIPLILLRFKFSKFDSITKNAVTVVIIIPMKYVSIIPMSPGFM